MQTFLPYPDFKECAKVLDRQRLGKQRVETLQILGTLKNGGSWSNHPAVKMWRGYENSLVEYGITMCLEWKRRGYKDTCLEKISRFKTLYDVIAPDWIGGAIHATHRSNLLRKSDYYKQFGWLEPSNLPYHWPI